MSDKRKGDRRKQPRKKGLEQCTLDVRARHTAEVERVFLPDGSVRPEVHKKAMEALRALVAQQKRAEVVELPLSLTGTFMVSNDGPSLIFSKFVDHHTFNAGDHIPKETPTKQLVRIPITSLDRAVSIVHCVMAALSSYKRLEGQHTSHMSVALASGPKLKKARRRKGR